MSSEVVIWELETDGESLIISKLTVKVTGDGISEDLVLKFFAVGARQSARVLIGIGGVTFNRTDVMTDGEV